MATKYISTRRLQYFYNKLFSEKISPIQTNVTKLKTVKEITLGTSWTKDSTNGYVTQTVSVSGITSDDKPVLDIKLSGTLSNMQTQQEEWSKVVSATTSSGKITFIASKATTTRLTILVKGV